MTCRLISGTCRKGMLTEVRHFVLAMACHALTVLVRHGHYEHRKHICCSQAISQCGGTARATFPSQKEIGLPMKGLPFVLLFTAMTFLSWGAYGPVLHHGAVAFDHDSMRAFVGVGLAYFLIAVLIPLAILKKGGENGRWTFAGTVYSLVAGAVGAIGALGIILALGYGGKTLYVMPLVFGFAPVVNTLVTAALTKSFSQIKPIFIAGIITAALGAAGVLYFKPAPPTPMPPSETPAASEDSAGLAPMSFRSMESQLANLPANTTQAASFSNMLKSVRFSMQTENETEGDEEAPESSESSAPVADAAEAASPPAAEISEATTGMQATAAEKTGDGSSVLGIALSIVIAALCWGSYGPMLHIGQAKMQGSRLRPFTCVGLAYFVIAVVVPLLLIAARPEDPGNWNLPGMLWSIGAGAAGAVGALGVILAFNAGGKPYYVMPLIFGFAPVINTFISLSEAGTWGQVEPRFWISLAVVIAGAVTVLINAPKPAKTAAKK